MSNSQKVTFKLSKKFLGKNIDFDGNIVIKIAVNCKAHKLLDQLEKSKLSIKPIKFSIVTSIEELPYKNKTSSRLYEEIKLINNLEVINNLDTDLELEN